MINLRIRPSVTMMHIVSFLPESYRDMVMWGIKINAKIENAYNQVVKKHGKVKADELMTQFKNEAFTGKEVNSDYIIRKLNDSANLETIQEQTN